MDSKMTELWTVERIANIYRRGDHFIGDTCSCGVEANVMAPAPGWFCRCGNFHCLSFNGTGRWPFDNPDMGPTKEMIQEGAKIGRGEE